METENVIYVYNEKGLNDTLLCIAQKQDESKIIETTVDGDITVLKQNDTIVGINIKHASQKIDIPFNGVLLEKNDAFETAVSKLIHEVNTEEVMETLAQDFVIGYVKEKKKHPDSDKLSVCQVDVGVETLQIVCGAKNVDADQVVVVAKIGCVMPTGLVIEAGVLRKEASNGMICSARELGLPEPFHNEGIMVLEGNAKVGTLFFEYYNKELKK